MKAKWVMTVGENGTNLTYTNLVSGISFDCGTTLASSYVGDFIDYALLEGADAGDGFFVGEKLVCEILLNKELNVKPRTLSN